MGTAVQIWTVQCGELAWRGGGRGPLLEDATVWNIARGKSKSSLRESPKISAIYCSRNDASVLSLSRLFSVLDVCHSHICLEKHSMEETCIFEVMIKQSFASPNLNWIIVICFKFFGSSVY